MRKIPYSRRTLFDRGPQLTYAGRDLDEIAFPLGGIGTGMVSLGGWGQLRDWEIMNRPAKGRAIPEAFFALKAQSGRKPPVVKVLQGPVGGSYVGDGSTVRRDGSEGLPHFREVSFTGRYPFAEVKLEDPAVPLKVTIEAFNPFIPLNDKDSSVPVAILRYRLENPGRTKVTATVFGNLTNVIGDAPEGCVNRARRGSGLTSLYLTTDKHDDASPKFGSLALTTPVKGASVWPRWKDTRISRFWEAIADGDKFPPKGRGYTDTGTLCVSIDVPAGKTVTVPFFISWHFPNYEHTNRPQARGAAPTWQNYYATQWKDAWDVARYVHRNFDRLHDDTKLFHDTLFASTLPAHVLDAVSSQISVLKSPTCLRLTDGTFYGFEGCRNDAGCCPGSCTHVWNYAQALPYLFPSLQRSMAEASFDNSMQPDGWVTFRMPLPLGTKAQPHFHPAADGQMGTVMQVYREWLISGDDDWLRKTWPKAKRALEFAWKYWDADKDGVMKGMQHNTYDIEFYGPNTMSGSLYLGALRAAEKMARAVGEVDAAEEYRRLFEKGSAWTDANLFNGEYYEQKVEPRAHEAWPEETRKRAERHGKDDRFNWPKWQYGRGCLSDQLIGQWYSDMLGLGYLYKRGNVRKTLQSIFRHNWRGDLSDHPCLLRVYALSDEAGLLICTWPKGQRPGYAFYFCDEVWCGIEYQVASHMIYEGMVEEGLAIVKGVRERHRGDRRNPWDEFECGHHYARSMASYAVMTALSGFTYSAPERRIGFAPRLFDKDFRCFFSVGSGWGLYSQKLSSRKATLTVDTRHGSLNLGELTYSLKHKPARVTATLGRRRIAAKIDSRSNAVIFDTPVNVEPGQPLRVSL